MISPRPALISILAAVGLAACAAGESPGTPGAPGGGGASGGRGTGGRTGGGTGGASASGGQGAGQGGAAGSAGDSGGGGAGGAPAPAAGGASGLGGGGSAGAAADGPAPPDGPAAPGACGALVCDDFEGYAAGSAPGGNWKPLIRSGTLAVDERKAWSGARSMRITNNGNADAKTFIEMGQPLLPLPANVMHGRLMFFLTKGPTGGANIHWEIVRGSGLLAGPGSARAQYNAGGEAGKFVINYEPNDCTKYSKVPFPEQKWACFQWEFNGEKTAAGTTKSEMKLWIDGTPVNDVSATPVGTCWRAPTFDTVHIGWQQYHAAQPVEIWIDDVAVGDKPIPCPSGGASKP